MGDLARLQTRAFGGEDVAARPDSTDDVWFPKGPLISGVSELIADIAKRTYDAKGLTVYFLLGGAGNGKSYAARALALRLKIALAERQDALARRKYEKEVDGVDIILLNDATIANRGDYGNCQSFALAADIDEWMARARTKPVIAFCCVNRGIVVDELRALGRLPAGAYDLSRRILAWIAGNADSIGEPGEEPPEDFRPNLDLGSHYRESSSTIDGIATKACALSVDSISLVARGADGESSAARQLLRETIDLCRAEGTSRRPECPIRANIANLSTEPSTEAWVGILKSAETAAGRFYSYRDLWALIALSVLGPRLPSTAAAGGAIGTVDSLLLELSGTTDPQARLELLLSLSRHRTNCSLFRSPVPRGQEAPLEFPPGTPFHAGLVLIDPATWGGSDSSQIEEAMASVAMGGCPSAELINAAHPISALWTPFDAALEQSILAVISQKGCSDVYRRGLLSWLAAYLVRLSALATGNIGNARVVRVLEACRQACQGGSAPLPAAIADGLRKLLLPETEGGGSQNVLVKAFAPRSDLIASDSESLALAEISQVASVGLQLRARGGRVVLESFIAGTDKSIGELTLDFALVREALAWSSGRPGQTDSSIFVEPRLERCRASTLASVPGNFRKLVILTPSGLVELTT